MPLKSTQSLSASPSLQILQNDQSDWFVYRSSGCAGGKQVVGGVSVVCDEYKDKMPVEWEGRGCWPV